MYNVTHKELNNFMFIKLVQGFAQYRRAVFFMVPITRYLLIWWIKFLLDKGGGSWNNVLLLLFTLISVFFFLRLATKNINLTKKTGYTEYFHIMHYTRTSPHTVNGHAYNHVLVITHNIISNIEFPYCRTSIHESVNMSWVSNRNVLKSMILTEIGQHSIGGVNQVLQHILESILTKKVKWKFW